MMSRTGFVAVLLLGATTAAAATTTTTTKAYASAAIAKVFARMTCAYSPTWFKEYGEAREDLLKTAQYYTSASQYAEQDSVAAELVDVIGNGAGFYFWRSRDRPDPLYSKNCTKDVQTLNTLLGNLGFEFYCESMTRVETGVMLRDCTTHLPEIRGAPTTTTVAAASTATDTTVTTTTSTTTSVMAEATTTATTTTTIITTVNYCKPAERGQVLQTDDCVSVPGLLPNAVINKGVSFNADPIAIPQAQNNHASDGKFGASEWDHVTPAVGRFTNAYIDYADGFLYILNDWIYNPTTPVSDNCYNLFTAFTGSGQQTWSIRVYGSGLVEVELNGKLLSQDKTNATGAIGFGTSPKQPAQEHTIFELAFAALPGNFGVQLHDPGPRFACSVLETEIVNFVGAVKSSGGGFVETVNAAEFTRRSLLRPTTTSAADSYPASSAETIQGAASLVGAAVMAWVM